MSNAVDRTLESLELIKVVKSEEIDEVDKLKLKRYGGTFYIYSEAQDE